MNDKTVSSILEPTDCEGTNTTKYLFPLSFPYQATAVIFFLVSHVLHKMFLRHFPKYKPDRDNLNWYQSDQQETEQPIFFALLLKTDCWFTFLVVTSAMKPLWLKFSGVGENKWKTSKANCQLVLRIWKKGQVQLYKCHQDKKKVFDIYQIPY